MLEVLALLPSILVTLVSAEELELDKNWHSAVVPIERKSKTTTKYDTKRIHKTYPAPTVQLSEDELAAIKLRLDTKFKSLDKESDPHADMKDPNWISKEEPAVVKQSN